MKDLLAYRVIVWHNDAVNGTHQSTKASGPTAEAALLEFSQYLQRPEWMRSFTPKHKVQLHGPDGFMFDIPAI
jgi:hypothetical protein